MKTALKWIAGIVGVVVVLIVGAAIAVPMLVSGDDIKKLAIEQVKTATGRDLTIGGQASVSLFSSFPSVDIKLGQVAFSNMPGGEAKSMASLKELVLSVDIGGALAKKVKVNSFVLVDPVINLEVDARGKPNWEFDAPGQKPAAPAAAQQQSQQPAQQQRPAAQQPGAAAGGGAPGTLPSISLGDVRLVNGTVSYTDKKSGTKERIEKIGMTLRLPDTTKPFGANGELTWHGEQISLKLDTGAPSDLVAGKPTGVKTGVQTKHLALAFDGTVTLAAALKAGGALDLKVPSIRELAAWTGNPLPKDAGGSGLGPLAIKGKVAVDGQKYSFADASLAIDAIKGTGAFAVDLSKGKPYANAKLDIEMLDVNPYLTKQQGKPAPAPASGGAASSGTAGGATPSGGAAAGAAAKPSDWSDDPIDASGLRAADADLALTVGGIRYQEIKIGKSALDVALKAGRMTADLKELALYDGKATAKIALDGAGPELGLQQSFALQGVKALPLLKDAAGFDRLDGNANGQVAVTSRGRTQRQIVQNLNGSGDLKFLNGAIIGINLAAMVRNVATAFLDSAAKETQKTDFAELGGTFKITNGILRNDDLFMAAPLVRVSGKGTSDLPKRTVDYRIEPKAVASTTGQGGQQQSGIAVPVNVKGPWHALSYQPDLGAALGIDAAGNLISGGAKGLGDAAKGAVQDITKGVQKPGDLLKGVLQGGGSSQQPAAGGQQQQQKGSGLPDAGKALKGLFGN